MSHTKFRFCILHVQKIEWGRGLKALERKFLPAPTPFVTEASILSRSLCVVTRFTKCLPVRFIPKELFVSLMRDDVVHDSGRSNASIAFTLSAQRMICEECQSSTAPGNTVASFGAGYSVSILVAICFCFVFRTVALTLMNESFTAWIVAEMEWHRYWCWGCRSQLAVLLK